MDKNTEFLNYIYQNSKMGTEAINSLLPKINDENLTKDLASQLNNYQNAAQDASSMLYKRGSFPKENTTMEKIGLHTGITFNTLIDSTPSHVAEMVINGSTMGIVDMTKKLKEYKDVDPQISELGNSLLHTEQKNIENLKTYL